MSEHPIGRYLDLRQKNSERYAVHWKNGVLLGDFIKDVDGYFGFWPKKRAGIWDAAVLEILAARLRELNEEWDAEIRAFFEAGK